MMGPSDEAGRPASDRMTTLDPSPTPFQADARTVVRTVRGAFSDLLAQAGANAQDPQSISERIGLTKTLAWKVSRMVQADDPALALQHMPGASGVKLLLRGAERAGVDPAHIEVARDAVRQFERLIEVHCGDRATLDMMGGQLSPAGRRQRDEQHRRMLFQGASYVWGAQARVVCKIGVVTPGEAPGLLDFASVNALVDFRRLRPDVCWVMASRHGRNDDGSQMRTHAAEAIDPRFSGPNQCPLMGDFCSENLPPLRRIDYPRGMSFELVEGPVGNKGSLSCAVGTIQRGIPYYAAPDNEWGEHRAVCDLPAELMIVDLFVHQSFAFAIPPQASLHSELAAGASDGPRLRRQLPLSEPLQDLGVSPEPPTTPEYPRYTALTRAVFARLGVDPGAFHGFRMKLPFPACPTSIMLRYRLPEEPAGGAG